MQLSAVSGLSHTFFAHQRPSGLRLYWLTFEETNPPVAPAAPPT